MGLAASQARLLTITARLADNELRSQTINNAKMRLAAQSSQVSDEYVTALNNAQLMFSNTDINGLARTQALTFNNLVSYSQYNNQYGLVNSAGLLLVNEQDAAIYEAHKNDLEGFLGEYGLKWDTTFFNAPEGQYKADSTVLSNKLVSFYGEGHIDDDASKGYRLGELFKGMTNEDLENLYLSSLTEEASIERLNYDNFARGYYREIKDLYENAIPAFREAILGNGADETQEEAIATGVADLYTRETVPGVGAELVRQFLLNGTLIDPACAYWDEPSGTVQYTSPINYIGIYNDGVTVVSDNPSENKYALNLIGSSLTPEGRKELSKIIYSLMDREAAVAGEDNMSGFLSNEMDILFDARPVQHFDITNPSKGDATEFEIPDTWAINNNDHDGLDLANDPNGYDYGEFTSRDTDDVYLSVQSSDFLDKDPRYDGNGDGYEVFLPGLTLNLDVPVYAKDKVTWEKLVPIDIDGDGTGDEWDTGNHDVLIRQYDGATGLPLYENIIDYTMAYDIKYDPADIPALEAWLMARKPSDFDSTTGALDATMEDFASRFTALTTADNEGKPGDPAEEKVNFRWDRTTKKLYFVPLHEAEDPDAISTYGQDEASRYETYKLLIDEYFTMLNSLDYFNTDYFAETNPDDPYLSDYSASMRDFKQYDTQPVAGTRAGNGQLESAVKKTPSYLLDFTSMLEGVGSAIYGYGSEAFVSVLNTYLADLMLDVLGEPKYAWVDANDPLATQNADAKAQWYSNLFSRMQKGYKVLENGLANSKEWIEYAFETGLVTMEQVDKSFNWVSLDYKTCANIYEDSDNSQIVAKAEAKYNRAMNDIKQKDNMFDLQLKSIDTEHQSLQTEYDSVKGVINKNIERTMKFDQSA